MKVNVTSNALLTIIAVCLVLITAKLYNVGFVVNAYGQWTGETLPTGRDLTPVALYAKHPNGKWFPCQISSDDKLVVEIQK